MPYIVSQPLSSSIPIFKVYMYAALSEYFPSGWVTKPALKHEFPALPERVVCDFSQVRLPAITLNINLTLKSEFELTTYFQFLGVSSIVAIATFWSTGYLKLRLARHRLQHFPSEYIQRSTLYRPALLYRPTLRYRAALRYRPAPL